MSQLPWILLAPLCASCVSCVEAPLRPPRSAVPIKSACTAGSRPASSVGLDVRPGRRHSEARTIFVTNVSDRPRAVRVEQVARVEGPCGGDWARQTTLGFADADTHAAPLPRTLAPGGEIQIQMGPQRAVATWDCVKLGLAVRMKVDDEVVCADAGAWIGERDDG